MKIRHNLLRTAVIGAMSAALLSLPVAAAPDGAAAINGRDLKAWLTYLASDELEGRALFSTGMGLAAAYIERHLKDWGVQPAGDGGSYLQAVRIVGVKASGRSSVTVQVGDDSRTFADGEGVTFPKDAGGTRRVTIDRVEFAGYGLHAPGINHADYAGASVRNAAVVWLGLQGPKAVSGGGARRLLSARSRYATEQLGAAAAIAPERPAAPRAAEAAAENAPDFTTARRLDAPAPPMVTAGDAFLTFLFSRAPQTYAELKRRADAREPLPRFRLDNVRITFNVVADYRIVRTQVSRNVVGVIEGSDPKLKHSYVALGAHYDHVGYADGELEAAGSAPRRQGAPGRMTAGAEDDRIWNGADDDGSGTVALMALARAFARGARPRRSLLFVWHTGEERGLYGSRYFADHPTVALDGIVAQLNVDMIGRNRDNDSREANTVYLVGSDRISTELHTLNREANAALARPLTLNYELNHPEDPEQLYTRSDHYSYAAKGIPVIFFTTGLHPDYHANTDDVSKIEFDKMTRITQLIYETARRVANLEHAPVRDHLGPRAMSAPR
jgi:hypothetical protein